MRRAIFGLVVTLGGCGLPGAIVSEIGVANERASLNAEPGLYESYSDYFLKTAPDLEASLEAKGMVTREQKLCGANSVARQMFSEQMNDMLDDAVTGRKPMSDEEILVYRNTIVARNSSVDEYVWWASRKCL